MSYGDTWNSDAQFESDARYSTKRDLETFAMNLESLNWSIVEHRQQAFDMIKDFGNNNTRYIVGHTQRFPEFATYIEYSGCNLPKQMAQLEAATSYKEASKHRNEPVKGKPQDGPNRLGKSNTFENHSGGTIEIFDSDDDARVGYYESIRSIKLITTTRSCLMDRIRFESVHGLKWS